MSGQPKISIRVFEDRPVRAVWDEETDKWWFAVVDIVGVLNEQDEYEKNRNYWKYLRAKLKSGGIQLGSGTTQLKITAQDGKKYLTDTVSDNGVIELVSNFPNNKNTKRFLDWFTGSGGSIDERSRQKAYELWESGLLDEIEVGTVKGLQQIHGYIFGGLYDFAGQIRTVNIAKGGFKFALVEFLEQTLATIEKMPEETLVQIADKYVEMNVAHPFREGNGRATRIWLDMMLKKNLKKCVDWSQIGKNEYLTAMRESVVDTTMIKMLLGGALTDRINDRELFMKGIDYSYYYEEGD